MTTTIQKQSQAQEQFYLNLFEVSEVLQVKQFEKEQKDKAVLINQHNKDIIEVGFETETIEGTMINRVVVFKSP